MKVFYLNDKINIVIKRVCEANRNRLCPLLFYFCVSSSQDLSETLVSQFTRQTSHNKTPRPDFKVCIFQTWQERPHGNQCSRRTFLDKMRRCVNRLLQHISLHGLFLLNADAFDLGKWVGTITKRILKLPFPLNPSWYGDKHRSYIVIIAESYIQL